jgi:hypothetical protein
MDDYLTKPVRAAELFAAIERVVSSEGTPRPAELDTGVSSSLLDPAALLAACDGDAELLRGLGRTGRRMRRQSGPILPSS